MIKSILSMFIFSLMVFRPCISIAQNNLDQNIEFESDRMSLKEVLLTIEQQSTYHFSFDPQTIREETQIDVPSRKLTIKKALEHLKLKHNIQFTLQDNVIILTKKRTKSTATLNGVIRDATTGELLAGAQLLLADDSKGAVSNLYGFYSLSHDQRKRETIRVTYIGYTATTFSFSFSSDSTANISLAPQSIELNSVIIQGDEANTKEIYQIAGSYKLLSSKIKDIATFGGEPDPLKALQFLPGVQSVNEGTTNISVRGGSSDQNLFLMDEAPVYNPSHALGFFSIFNADALQSVTLYKSDIPVSYGGRLSSVVSVQTKEGNRAKTKVSGAVGTIASRLSVEGPLSKKNDKTSFIISGRYSYAGAVANGIYLAGQQVFGDPTANISTTNNTISFYDANAKINYRRNDKNHFYLSVYSGHDSFYFSHITNGYSLAWGNTTGTFRWNHVHGPRLFSNLTAVFSDYKYEYTLLDNTRYFLWGARLSEVSVKEDFDFYPNAENHVTFGAGIQLHRIEPGTVKPRSETAVTRTYSLEQQRPMSAYAYVGNETTLSEKLTLKYGLRYSNLIIAGPHTRYFFNDNNQRPYDSIQYSSGEIEKVFHRLDPRAAFIFNTAKGSITASYDRTTQYFHFLANSSVGLPTDIWMPSGGKIKPQTADIFAINYQQPLGAKYDGSVGTFYKRLHNILDFKDNANLFVNRYIESQLLQGSGNSYGAEFFLQKISGPLRGSVSYTWSKTEHRIAGVNNDKVFSPRYDKRHNLSITAKWDLSKRWTLSGNFVFTTGSALTLPSGNFNFDGVAFNTYSGRNSFRLPNYHRADISIRYNSRKNDNRKYKSYWALDVYNVYGRKNPFTVYAQQTDHMFYQTKVNAIYLYKMVPSISYNFSF